MSTDETPAPSETPTPAPSADVQPLNMRERRVVGVLAEKGQTTPEAYPLSVNALLTGCNQKSNRDPVTTFDDADVEQALETLESQGLVQRVQGGRVDRWRHLLYEKWGVTKVELAVLAELLLRGPQSVGDLRGRASRMEPIDSLDRLREVLKPLVERKLVVWLTPESRRGALITHGFHPPEELEGLRSKEATSAPYEFKPARAGYAATKASPADEGQLKEEVERLRTDVDHLKTEVARLASIIDQLMLVKGAEQQRES
jgi:uncharacterized protein YceH (UPF0502 family)